MGRGRPRQGQSPPIHRHSRSLTYARCACHGEVASLETWLRSLRAAAHIKRINRKRGSWEVGRQGALLNRAEVHDIPLSAPGDERFDVECARGAALVTQPRAEYAKIADLIVFLAGLY